MRTPGTIPLIIVVLLCCLTAQASAAPKSVIVSAASLNPATSDQRYAMSGPWKYSLDLGVSDFAASIDLVPGTSVISFELEACDESSTGSIQARLQSCSPAVNNVRMPCNTIALVVTTDTDKPGCQTFTVPAVRYKVLKGAQYQVEVTIADSDTEDVAVKSVRALYVSGRAPSVGMGGGY
jgi:hypothetical protein